MRRLDLHSVRHPDVKRQRDLLGGDGRHVLPVRVPLLRQQRLLLSIQPVLLCGNEPVLHHVKRGFHRMRGIDLHAVRHPDVWGGNVSQLWLLHRIQPDLGPGMHVGWIRDEAKEYLQLPGPDPRLH
jgi:hypothetical protein